MRILLILVLLLANLMLFGANHQMFGPVPYAGLRNPAPLKRELNPSGMQIRPMAPGEYVDHPVVGPADPSAPVRQEELATPVGALSASAASAASATPAAMPTPASAAPARVTSAATPSASSSPPAASAPHPHKPRKPHHPHA